MCLCLFAHRGGLRLRFLGVGVGLVGRLVWRGKWCFCVVHVIGRGWLLCIRKLCLGVQRRANSSSLGRFCLGGSRG